MTDAPPVSPATQPLAVEPNALAWANMTPQQRFEHQQQQNDALTGTTRPGIKPGERVDEATYERMTFDERAAYAAQFQQQAGTRVPDAVTPPEQLEPRPADPAASRVKIGEVEATEAEWRDAMAFKAAEESKRLSLPAEPKDYKLELPKDLVLPQGVQITFNERDPINGPIIDQVRQWAHSRGLGQEDFSSLLGFYAASQVHEQTLINQAVKAENEKLGPAGAARIDAVTRWLKADLGDELAAPLLTTMVTEKHVRAYEKMLQQRSSQGVGGFSQAHRDVNDHGKIDAAAYERMSYSERKAYAGRFPQANGSGGY